MGINFSSRDGVNKIRWGDNVFGESTVKISFGFYSTPVYKSVPGTPTWIFSDEIIDDTSLIDGFNVEAAPGYMVNCYGYFISGDGPADFYLDAYLDGYSNVYNELELNLPLAGSYLKAVDTQVMSRNIFGAPTTVWYKTDSSGASLADCEPSGTYSGKKDMIYEVEITSVAPDKFKTRYSYDGNTFTTWSKEYDCEVWINVDVGNNVNVLFWDDFGHVIGDKYTFSVRNSAFAFDKYNRFNMWGYNPYPYETGKIYQLGLLISTYKV